MGNQGSAQSAGQTTSAQNVSPTNVESPFIPRIIGVIRDLATPPTCIQYSTDYGLLAAGTPAGEVLFVGKDQAASVFHTPDTCPVLALHFLEGLGQAEIVIVTSRTVYVCDLQRQRISRQISVADAFAAETFTSAVLLCSPHVPQVLTTTPISQKAKTALYARALHARCLILGLSNGSLRGLDLNTMQPSRFFLDISRFGHADESKSSTGVRDTISTNATSVPGHTDAWLPVALAQSEADPMILFVLLTQASNNPPLSHQATICVVDLVAVHTVAVLGLDNGRPFSTPLPVAPGQAMQWLAVDNVAVQVDGPCIRVSCPVIIDEESPRIATWHIPHSLTQTHLESLARVCMSPSHIRRVFPHSIAQLIHSTDINGTGSLQIGSLRWARCGTLPLDTQVCADKVVTPECSETTSTPNLDTMLPQPLTERTPVLYISLASLSKGGIYVLVPESIPGSTSSTEANAGADRWLQVGVPSPTANTSTVATTGPAATKALLKLVTSTHLPQLHSLAPSPTPLFIDDRLEGILVYHFVNNLYPSVIIAANNLARLHAENPNNGPTEREMRLQAVRDAVAAMNRFEDDGYALDSEDVTPDTTLDTNDEENDLDDSFDVEKLIQEAGLVQSSDDNNLPSDPVSNTSDNASQEGQLKAVCSSPSTSTPVDRQVSAAGCSNESPSPSASLSSSSSAPSAPSAPSASSSTSPSTPTSTSSSSSGEVVPRYLRLPLMLSPTTLPLCWPEQVTSFSLCTASVSCCSIPQQLLHSLASLPPMQRSHELDSCLPPEFVQYMRSQAMLVRAGLEPLEGGKSPPIPTQSCHQQLAFALHLPFSVTPCTSPAYPLLSVWMIASSDASPTLISATSLADTPRLADFCSSPQNLCQARIFPYIAVSKESFSIQISMLLGNTSSSKTLFIACQLSYLPHQKRFGKLELINTCNLDSDPTEQTTSLVRKLGLCTVPSIINGMRTLVSIGTTVLGTPFVILASSSPGGGLEFTNASQIHFLGGDSRHIGVIRHVIRLPLRESKPASPDCSDDFLVLADDLQLLRISSRNSILSAEFQRVQYGVDERSPSPISKLVMLNFPTYPHYCFALTLTNGTIIAAELHYKSGEPVKLCELASTSVLNVDVALLPPEENKDVDILALEFVHGIVEKHPSAPVLQFSSISSLLGILSPSATLNPDITDASCCMEPAQSLPQHVASQAKTCISSTLVVIWRRNQVTYGITLLRPQLNRNSVPNSTTSMSTACTLSLQLLGSLQVSKPRSLQHKISQWSMLDAVMANFISDENITVAISNIRSFEVRRRDTLGSSITFASGDAALACLYSHTPTQTFIPSRQRSNPTPCTDKQSQVTSTSESMLAFYAAAAAGSVPSAQIVANSRPPPTNSNDTVKFPPVVCAPNMCVGTGYLTPLDSETNSQSVVFKLPSNPFSSFVAYLVSPTQPYTPPPSSCIDISHHEPVHAVLSVQDAYALSQLENLFMQQRKAKAESKHDKGFFSGLLSTLRDKDQSTSADDFADHVDEYIRLRKNPVLNLSHQFCKAVPRDTSISKGLESKPLRPEANRVVNDASAARTNPQPTHRSNTSPASQEDRKRYLLGDGANSSSTTPVSESSKETHEERMARWQAERDAREQARLNRQLVRQNIEKLNEIGDSAARINQSSQTFVEKVKELRRRQEESWW